MKYLEQSPNDLKLCLSEGSIPDIQFTLIKELHIQTEEYSLKAYIIGESHFIEIVAESHKITEVFACVDHLKNSTYISYPLLEAVSHGFKPRPFGVFKDWQYRVAVDVISGPLSNKSQFSTLCRLKREVGNFMMHEFPCKSSLPFKPVTAVHISTKYATNRLGKNLLISWETLHSHPNHNCVVHTRSSVGIPT